MFVVFDLDGTLSDDRHRRHLLDGTDSGYDAYYAACVDDPPILPVIHTMRLLMLSALVRVEIWTGRRGQLRADTVAWLEAHGIPGRTLVRMRPAGDRSSVVSLKRGWLREACATAGSRGGAPDAVYEDRGDLVIMWREEGVICFQVGIP